jgi:hypothetical protein
MATARVRINLDLPPDLDNWLRAQAGKQEVSRNALIVDVLDSFRRAVVDLEDDDLDSLISQLRNS